MNVIHRKTLEFKPSVNTPDYPEPEWKHDPNMKAVAGVDSRYWKAPADWDASDAGPVVMTRDEKASADEAQPLSERDKIESNRFERN